MPLLAISLDRAAKNPRETASCKFVCEDLARDPCHGPNQPDLARAQPLTVGDQEQRAVAWTGPRDGEQPGESLATSVRL